MNRHVICLVTLDDVLWFILGSVSLVTFEHELRGYFLLDGSTNSPRFRIPLHMIAPLEVGGHLSDLLFSGYPHALPPRGNVADRIGQVADGVMQAIHLPLQVGQRRGRLDS